MNMVKMKMAEFVMARGNTIARGKTIYRKQKPTMYVKSQNDGNGPKEAKSHAIPDETPK
jgi:hypothetical protein